MTETQVWYKVEYSVSFTEVNPELDVDYWHWVDGMLVLLEELDFFGDRAFTFNSDFNAAIASQPHEFGPVQFGTSNGDTIRHNASTWELTEWGSGYLPRPVEATIISAQITEVQLSADFTPDNLFPDGYTFIESNRYLWDGFGREETNYIEQDWSYYIPNSMWVSDVVDIARTVTIEATDATAAEPDDNGEFTVMLSEASDTDTVINYTVSGDADQGADYQALSGSVTIPAGEIAAKIAIEVIDDNEIESIVDETVTLTLSNVSAGIATIVGPSVATVTIADNDIHENSPPVAEDDFYQAKIGFALGSVFAIVLHVNVLENDKDPDGDPLTASEGTGNGFSLTSSGVLLFVATCEFGDEDSNTSEFETIYYAMDSHGEVDYATIGINIPSREEILAPLLAQETTLQDEINEVEIDLNKYNKNLTIMNNAEKFIENYNAVINFEGSLALVQGLANLAPKWMSIYASLVEAAFRQEDFDTNFVIKSQMLLNNIVEALAESDLSTAGKAAGELSAFLNKSMLALDLSQRAVRIGEHEDKIESMNEKLNNAFLENEEIDAKYGGIHEYLEMREEELSEVRDKIQIINNCIHNEEVFVEFEKEGEREDDFAGEQFIYVAQEGQLTESLWELEAEFMM